MINIEKKRYRMMIDFKSYHATTEILKLNELIDDEQDTTININCIHCSSDACLAEGFAVKSLGENTTTF